MSNNTVTNRDLDCLPTDKAAVWALTQAACDVELFTIPLYMTALYSLYGTYSTPASANDLWPGVRPFPTVIPPLDIPDFSGKNPNRVSQPNQEAYNAIFSVFIQEMLHLQLAANLANAVRHPEERDPIVNFTAPDYNPNTNNNSIPYVGSPTKIKRYEGVQVKLGPLDTNQIRLFLAIETPDSVYLQESNDEGNPLPPPPPVPFSDWKSGDPLPLFGTIGHLYESIQEYLDMKYSDGETLWQKMYNPNAIQIDRFNFEGKYHPAPEYPKFFVTFPPGRDANNPCVLQTRKDMISAILDQGEGSPSPDNVPPQFVPSESNLAKDVDQNSAAVRFEGDKISHYQRFLDIQCIVPPDDLANPSADEYVWTFPTFWKSRHGSDAWTADDLTMGTEGKHFAEKRADALNSLNQLTPTVENPNPLQNALNLSYSSLIDKLQDIWSKQDIGFPDGGMQALFTRAATVWAINQLPEFKYVPNEDRGLPHPGQPAHACQGLNPNTPGMNDCANAVIHTCGGLNSCQYQGGCGYPNPTAEDLGYPSVNAKPGDGGCGAPIPVAQHFNTYNGTKWEYNNVAFGVDCTPEPTASPPYVGCNVWDAAWAIFKNNPSVKNWKNPDDKDKDKPQKMTDLRLVLPPS